MMREAERPIIEELARVGVEARTVWDLVDGKEDTPAIADIFIRNLQLGTYPKIILLGMGTALGRRLDPSSWARLRRLYLETDVPGTMEASATALARLAKKPHYDELLTFLTDDTRGDSRILFLPAIRRVGRERGREFLETLRGDAFFGKEVELLLGKPT